MLSLGFTDLIVSFVVSETRNEWKSHQIIKKEIKLQHNCSLSFIVVVFFTEMKGMTLRPTMECGRNVVPIFTFSHIFSISM